MEFSKWLIILDYVMMILLVILTVRDSEIAVVAIAWVAQLGVSTGFYFWKAKNENRIKIPVQILKSLRRDPRYDLDLNQIITAIIEKD